MILPGRSIIPAIISNVRSAKIQAQPCGVDLTLKRIKKWTSQGSVDFENSLRVNASTVEVPFIWHHKQVQIDLPKQLRVTLQRSCSLSEEKTRVSYAQGRRLSSGIQ